MEETREETPQDLRNLALKVAGLLEEAGQHALHDQLNPRNLAQPSAENADRGPRYKLEVDSKILRFMSSRIADIAHFDGFWTTRPAESRPGQRYWYIGKIDGVINYVRHMSEWTVTAALFEFGPDNEPKPIIGIVHAPALGLTYLAARGAGAVRIHKTTVGEKRDKVVPSMTSSLDGSVLGYGMSFLPGESQRALDVASSLAGRRPTSSVWALPRSTCAKWPTAPTTPTSSRCCTCGISPPSPPAPWWSGRRRAR